MRTFTEQNPNLGTSRVKSDREKVFYFRANNDYLKRNPKYATTFQLNMFKAHREYYVALVSQSYSSLVCSKSKVLLITCRM